MRRPGIAGVWDGRGRRPDDSYRAERRNVIRAENWLLLKNHRIRMGVTRRRLDRLRELMRQTEMSDA